jgi:hypothetical protein
VLTEFPYAHCFNISSLFLHMLIILICGHCFYICVAWRVSSWLLSGSVDPLWYDSFFAPTSTLSLSSLPSLACDEIVQLQKLFRIWADDLELVRNLASLPNAPTVFVDMLTVFMMPLCSKFLIKWWLTYSETYCLCRYAHCFYIYSLSLHMLTVLTYAHYLYICSLFYICSLSLYTLTIFTYAHCVYIWSLFLYMLNVFTYAHCFYICSLSLHMLTVFIYAHWVYIWSLCLYVITVFTYANCRYICSLFLYMLTVLIYAHYFYIRSLSLHMVTVFIYAHWIYICSLFWSMLTVFIYAH